MSKITLVGFYNYDSHLFDNLTLPVGIDKETVVNNILIKGGEFEVIYANPNFIKNMIRVWSNKWNRTFTKWLDALNVEYNPLENYDRREEWTDKGKADSNSDSLSRVSAYNSDTMRDNAAGQSKSETESENFRTGRAHGNIGVLTSQQMLEAELDIATWNLYEHITDIFLSEFVIAIY